MRISIASDHGGFELKEAIKNHLIEEGYEVIDCGTHSKDSVDYPLFGEKAANLVASNEARFGILVCTTGEGISIAANKVKGIRCGIGYSDNVAAKIREHNDCNMIAFGQNETTSEEAIRRTDIFLKTEFLGDRHARRVGEIMDIEKRNC